MISHKANSPVKLLLPKLIVKPTLFLNNHSKADVPDPIIYNHIASVIEKLGVLSKNKTFESFKFVELKEQLTNIAIQCRKSQCLSAYGAKAQQEVKYLKLKVKSLETDLHFRQEQVIRLQNRIKAMSQFYSRQCLKPRNSYRPGSPQNCILSTKIKAQKKEPNEVIASEYGIANKQKFKARLNYKSVGKENILNTFPVSPQLKPQVQSTMTSTIQPSSEIISPSRVISENADKIQQTNEVKQPQEKTERSEKKQKSLIQIQTLKISRSSQTEITPEANVNQFKEQFKEDFYRFKDTCDRKVSQLNNKTKQLTRLAYIYRMECHELTQGQIKLQLQSLRHSLSVDSL